MATESKRHAINDEKKMTLIIINFNCKVNLTYLNIKHYINWIKLEFLI